MLNNASVAGLPSSSLGVPPLSALPGQPMHGENSQWSGRTNPHVTSVAPPGKKDAPGGYTIVHSGKLRRPYHLSPPKQSNIIAPPERTDAPGGYPILDSPCPWLPSEQESLVGLNLVAPSGWKDASGGYPAASSPIPFSTASFHGFHAWLNCVAPPGRKDASGGYPINNLPSPWRPSGQEVPAGLDSVAPPGWKDAPGGYPTADSSSPAQARDRALFLWLSSLLLGAINHLKSPLTLPFGCFFLENSGTLNVAFAKMSH